MSLSFRALWLSDIHLGTNPCRAADLLEFLSGVSADRLYLVGDIIDLERLKVRPRFPELHRRVIREFVRLATAGTEVIYIPGNHDEEMRDLAGSDLCGIPIMLEAEHRTEDGRCFLVMHGDALDRRIRRGTNLEHFGAAAYRVLTEADVKINQLRQRLGWDFAPITTGIKRRLRSAVEYMQRFERVAADHARERGFDGIICGHIHRPAIRDFAGICYANDGDWVEHRTALAEAADGSLHILRWQTDSVFVESLPRTAPLAA